MIKRWVCAYRAALDIFVWADWQGEVPDNLQESSLILYVTYNGKPPPFPAHYIYAPEKLGIQICGKTIIYMIDDKPYIVQNETV